MSANASTPTRSEHSHAPPGSDGTFERDKTRKGATNRDRGDAALCRGVLYSALALGFRPPTNETLERLTSAEGVAALADGARALEALSRFDGISARAEDLALHRIGLETGLTAYRDLFGHTARGEVPAYETEYGNEALFQQPQELSDLAGFAAAFGLLLRAETHERIDHVSCECEFMAFLAYKEAYAIEQGDEEMLAATSHAAKLFLRDHLGRFAPAFARRLMRVDRCRFYGALAGLMLALVAHDCQRLGVPTGSEGLGLRPDPTAVSAPMGCGLAGEASGCGTGGCG